MNRIEEYDRDTQYWNTFYEKNTPNTMPESNFAGFVSKYVKQGKTLIDIGCGNGRDSIYFKKLGLNVVGIDASDACITQLNQLYKDSFICGNFINDKEIYQKKNDYFYSRFTVHAIDEQGEDELLKNIYDSLTDGGMLFIEVRGIHDTKFGQGEQVARNAFILDNHYRRFIVLEELLSKLIRLGYHIKYAEEAKDFAPYKDENPEVIRVVAVK